MRQLRQCDAKHKPVHTVTPDSGLWLAVAPLMGWLGGYLVGACGGFDLVAGWLAGWKVGLRLRRHWLGWLVGWLVGWLAPAAALIGWLLVVGWLVGWLAPAAAPVGWLAPAAAYLVDWPAPAAALADLSVDDRLESECRDRTQNACLLALIDCGGWHVG